MSNWIGGLPGKAKTQNDIKKAIKSGIPASPPDGGDPKTFYGGAIPPVSPKLPKYKKEELPPKVEITEARSPINKYPLAEPKVPLPSSPAKPPKPSSPPKPSPSPVSKPALQSYSPPPLPKHIPSAFDKKPTKRKKKKKKRKPPTPPPHKPIQCSDDVRNDPGEEDLGQIPSIFAICHIPATCKGLGLEECGGYGEKEDRFGHASPEEDEGLDIPPAVLSYMLRDEFAGIFGKKIDARNLADVGPHGWTR